MSTNKDAAQAIGTHDLGTSTGGRAYIAEFFTKRLGRHDFSRYIAERLAADFACALAGYLSERDAAPEVRAASVPQIKPRLLHQLRRFNECCEDPDAGGHDVDREDMHSLAELGAVRPVPGGRHYMTDFGHYLLAARSGDDAAPEPVNLEGLREKLMAPREIVRDNEGWLWHPDYPVCDEGTHAGKFLEAFGIEAEFVSMESDDPEGGERYFEAGEPDCSYWTPTTPEGDGWLLLEIYDTEDGPVAMFGRDLYAAEQARKKENTRKLAEEVRRRRIAATAASGGDQEVGS